MEVTPGQGTQVEQDSGCFTASFENVKIPFESTPNDTPKTSRKRKATLLQPPSLAQVCPTPQFSSTLNESLLNNLEKCTITPQFYADRTELSFEHSKYVKLNDSQPTPSTPVKEKSQNTYYLKSPYKEAIDILYPAKVGIPASKSLAPPKRIGANRIFSPAKKRLFESDRVDPMKRFGGIEVILRKIFEYLSDGDLYRISMVSKTWNTALLTERRASARYKDFVEKHKVNKENYSITPSDSPPSPDSPPVSPGRLQFHAFTKVFLPLFLFSNDIFTVFVCELF